jgi:phasin family protein
MTHDTIAQWSDSRSWRMAGRAGDLPRLISDISIPGRPDIEALATALKRKMEMLSAANRLATEGAQAVTRRHMAIMQQTMSELTEAIRMLAGLADKPQARTERHRELLTKAYEGGASNMRESGELIRRINAEAMELLRQRCFETPDEVTEPAGTAGSDRS